MTELGKFLRKIRIDHQELLKDMAAKLKVSSAFLSAVEVGRKKAPSDFVNRISENYNLTHDEKLNLLQAADMSAKEVKMNLQEISANQRNVAVSFAKVLNGLSDEDIAEIMKVFNKSRRRGK